MTESERGLATAQTVLRIAFGVTAFLAGLDKFFNLLADWPAYLAPAVGAMVPLQAATLMKVVGVIEMVAGLVVLSKQTRLGAYVVTAWLTLIAVQLLLTGKYFDLAVRDLVMACGAFTLAKLTEWRASVPVRSTAAARSSLAHA